MSKNLKLLLFATFIFACLLIVGSVDRFQAMSVKLQGKVVPTQYLDDGQLGRVLKNLNLVFLENNDNSIYSRSNPEELTDKAPVVAIRKRMVGDYLYRSNPGRARDLPSTLVMRSQSPLPNVPIISIVVDDAHLFDEKRGIITHPKKRGQDWERPAYFSFFEDGKLSFATGIGLRVHGNRGFSPERGPSGYRLYFRKEYGYVTVKPNTLFKQSGGEVSRVVARRDKGGAFNNELAYDIARAIGAIVPKSNAALLYLNGEYLGVRSVTEHVSQRQWESRLGHSNFDFYRYKSTNDINSELSYEELSRWLKDSKRVLGIEEFEAKINVRGLVLNLFTFMFLGTTDWFQGAAVRDNNAANPVWDWVIWDLDHSFRDKERQKQEDKYGTLTEKFQRMSWEQPAFALVAKKNAHGKWKRSYTRRSVRGDLFVRLLNDDPNFARYFLKTVSELLNHKLTKEYIGTLFKKYSTFAENIHYSKSIQESIGKKMEFLKHRPDFVRLRLAQIFDVPEIYTVSVVGSNTLTVDIDGYSEKLGYQGKYFSGGDLSIRANSDYNLKHWVVNGRVVHDKHLKLIVNSDVLVEPVFVEP